MRVMGVGGGGGGLTHDGDGGGSGYVGSGEYSVTPKESIWISVGVGGDGSIGYNASTDEWHQSAGHGGHSLFGSHRLAEGGAPPSPRDPIESYSGGDGGSGGGQGQLCLNTGSGSGGTGGSDGEAPKSVSHGRS